MEYIAMLATSFIYVASKSFQQLNVVHEKILQIIPTSYFMAYLEIGTLGMAAKAIIDHGVTGFALSGFAMGTGAWIGSICAIYIHKWLRKERHVDFPLGK